MCAVWHVHLLLAGVRLLLLLHSVGLVLSMVVVQKVGMSWVMVLVLRLEPVVLELVQLLRGGLVLLLCLLSLGLLLGLVGFLFLCGV